MSAQSEMQSLCDKNDGLLRPVDMVAFAKKNPDSAIHHALEWADSTAAHAHRLWQCRQLIKTYVMIEPSTSVEFSVFVSLDEDRDEDGGYRELVRVLEVGPARSCCTISSNCGLLRRALLLFC